MQPTAAQDQTVVVTGLSNREFLELYARPLARVLSASQDLPRIQPPG
jgi:hypothetical protein